MDAVNIHLGQVVSITVGPYAGCKGYVQETYTPMFQGSKPTQYAIRVLVVFPGSANTADCWVRANYVKAEPEGKTDG